MLRGCERGRAVAPCGGLCPRSRQPGRSSARNCTKAAPMCGCSRLKAYSRAKSYPSAATRSFGLLLPQLLLRVNHDHCPESHRSTVKYGRLFNRVGHLAGRPQSARTRPLRNRSQPHPEETAERRPAAGFPAFVVGPHLTGADRASSSPPDRPAAWRRSPRVPARPGASASLDSGRVFPKN